MDFEQTLASKISLVNAKRYLRKSGWVESTSINPDLVKFHRQEPDRPFDEVRLPKREDDKFYSDTLLELAQRLSVFEKRPLFDVMMTLQSPDVDKIRFRIISENVQFGSIELGCIDTLFHAISSVCSIAVKDAYTPSFFHKRIDGKLVKQLQKYARLGQTNPGSFTVNILVPTSIPPEDDTIPFEGFENNEFRKGMTHLMESLKQIDDLIMCGDEDSFIPEMKKKPSVSSNFINSMLQINQWDDMELEISIQWSPINPVESTVPHSVRLPQSYFKVFQKWSNECISKKECKNELEFTGNVIALEGNIEDENGKIYGDVVIQYISNEGDSGIATVTLLNREYYDLALNCHRNKIMVKFRGDLIPGKNARIDNVIDFMKVTESK